ncbi:MAG: chorismate synthase [Planctomycetia bacterium]|nr:chorismate synthase [Planctomycetia bacterium]
MLNYNTAGESHGKGLLALVDCVPAGLDISTEVIDYELRRRQGGYGRGGRQAIETDAVEILSGVWGTTTIGSPVALWVKNKDYRLPQLEDLSSPRPGHGDLSGSRKYLSSMRGILERASARETAARVAAGALARQILSAFGIEVVGFVTQIGDAALPVAQGAEEHFAMMEAGANSNVRGVALQKIRALRDGNELYSLALDQDNAKAIEAIENAKSEGDTLGGVVEVRATGIPFGLGTHAQWNQKLDGRLAQAIMAIQAIKGVEIGLGFRAAGLPGSQVHDPIHFDPLQEGMRTLGFSRPSNNAGGLEAGMTNAQPIVVRAAMKPIATLRKPLDSVEMKTRRRAAASWERSDVCAVSAASVVVENAVAFEIASALTEKFGCDSMEEIGARLDLSQSLQTRLRP